MISADLYEQLIRYSRKCCQQWGIPELYLDIAHDIICEEEVIESSLSSIFFSKKKQVLDAAAKKMTYFFSEVHGSEELQSYYRQSYDDDQVFSFRPMIVYKQCINPDCKDVMPEHEFYHTTGKSTRPICKKCFNKKDEGRKREQQNRDRGDYTKLFLTKDRKQLSDSYVKDILKKNGISKDDISPAMIAEKRLSIETKRNKSKNKVTLINANPCQHKLHN